MCEVILTKRLSVKSQNDCSFSLSSPPSYFATSSNILPCGWLSFLPKPIVHSENIYTSQFFFYLSFLSGSCLPPHTCCIIGVRETFTKIIKCFTLSWKWWPLPGNSYHITYEPMAFSKSQLNKKNYPCRPSVCYGLAQSKHNNDYGYKCRQKVFLENTSTEQQFLQVT